MPTHCKHQLMSVLVLYQNNELYATTVDDINYIQADAVKHGIIYGCAIGLCSVFMIMLCLFSSRRKSVFFMLNQLTLTLMIIRSALCLNYLLGPFNTIDYIITGDVPRRAHNAYMVSVTANSIQVPLIATTLISFVFQVNQIFKSPEMRLLRFAIVGVMSSLSAVVIALYLYKSVIFAQESKIDYDRNYTPKHTATWVNNLPFLMFSVAVNLCSIALLAKLVIAIKLRRKLGLRRFDKFHILFIVSCQTLVIPSVLEIVNYGVMAEEDNLITCAYLLTVLSLPLSSMWATSANNIPFSSASSTLLSMLSRQNSCHSDKTITPSEYHNQVIGLGDSSHDLEKCDNLKFETKTVHSGQGSMALLESSIPFEIRQLMKEVENDCESSASIRENKNGPENTILETWAAEQLRITETKLCAKVAQL